MPLTTAEVKSLKCPPDRKMLKKSDGNGFFLLIKSNQSKLWRFRYKFAGKYQEMALGKYPLISLSEAREATKNARILLTKGINPMEERRKNKRLSNHPDKSFFQISMRWWDQQQDSWTPDSAKRVKRWLTTDTESINDLAIDMIDAGHITDLMLEIEAKGTPKKAPNVLSVINSKISSSAVLFCHLKQWSVCQWQNLQIKNKNLLKNHFGTRRTSYVAASSLLSTSILF